jgi:hypothetical protein
MRGHGIGRCLRAPTVAALYLALHGPRQKEGANLRVLLGMSATHLLVFHSTLSSESSYSVLSRRKRLAARSVIVEGCAKSQQASEAIRN